MDYYGKYFISRYKMGCIATASQERQRRARGTVSKPSIRREQIALKIQPSYIPSTQSRVDPEKSKKQIVPTKIQIKLAKLQLIFDKKCPLFSSYESSDDIIFKKINFNWFSLPIVSPVNFKEPCFFAVRNISIKYNHFVAGIIREVDLRNLVTSPWKTEGVVCYQSSSKKGGSWIRHGERTHTAGREVACGQTLSIILRQKKIQFWIQKYFQGDIPIPQQFLSQICLPYVAVFCRQDTFQIGIQNPMQPYYPP